jgi:hypothetical protein|eukprot:COSAG06_NODE_4499_length_4201_cov_6.056070_2_plen_50_part_00
MEKARLRVQFSHKTNKSGEVEEQTPKTKAKRKAGRSRGQLAQQEEGGTK